MVTFMVLVCVLCAPVALGYFWYARIIARRNKVLEALADIDVQLTKRHDLIPNILKIAARFMEHERSLMADITALRGKAQSGIGSRDSAAVDAHLQAESQLQGVMSRFLALVENYPQLKSDATMIRAQSTYNEVEEHIAAARRFYNAAVGALNNAVQIFPGTVFASMAGVTEYPFYHADEASKAPVDVDEYLTVKPREGA